MKINWQKNKRAGLAALTVALSALGVQQSALAGPEFQVGEQGYMQLSYAVQIWAQNRGFTSATDNGSQFDTFLRRNRITLNGQYSDLIGFYAQLEAGNDSKGGNSDRAVYYRDAYLTVDYTDAMRLIIGRYKNTFSRENLEACLEPLTLDRGELLPYTPFGGTRDTGITLWGNLSDAKYQYRLSITDGREGDAVVKDSPRITGRVHVSLFEPEYSYGYRGTYLGTQKVLTIGAAFDTQANVAYDNYATRSGSKDYTATTVDIFYENPYPFGTVTATAAVFDYSIDGYPSNPDPALSPLVERKGSYAKFGFMLPEPVGSGRLQFFARLEQTDYAADTGFSDQTFNAIGANYYLNGQNLKLTFEHASVKFDTQNPTNASLQDYDQTTFGLQMIF
jgi:hypothetical protein